MSVDVPSFSTDLMHEDGSVLLCLAGDLDLAAADTLLSAIDIFVGPHLRALILDLSALSFVDVAGLRSLLAAAGCAAQSGAKFRLRSPSDVTLRILRLADFPELLAAVEPALI